jgi:hypothetical protein
MVISKGADSRWWNIVLYLLCWLDYFVVLHPSTPPVLVYGGTPLG